MFAYLRRPLRRRSDDGASAVEYGLLVAAIAAIIILLVFAIGKFVQKGFQDTCDNLSKNPSAGQGAAAPTCPAAN